MPRWSIPILWYLDSAITSLYQPVLTPIPLGDSASKAWSLLDNVYPQQDSALAYARASLRLGTDIRASLYLLTRNANPTGLIHSSCTVIKLISKPSQNDFSYFIWPLKNGEK